MAIESKRPKILGIGYPKFAIAEYEELAAKYDIHYFHPDDRKQVIGEVKRIAEEHGPFDASWVVSPPFYGAVSRSEPGGRGYSCGAEAARQAEGGVNQGEAAGRRDTRRTGRSGRDVMNL